MRASHTHSPKSTSRQLCYQYTLLEQKLHATFYLYETSSSISASRSNAAASTVTLHRISSCLYTRQWLSLGRTRKNRHRRRGEGAEWRGGGEGGPRERLAGGRGCHPVPDREMGGVWRAEVRDKGDIKVGQPQSQGSPCLGVRARGETSGGRTGRRGCWSSSCSGFKVPNAGRHHQSLPQLPICPSAPVLPGVCRRVSR